MPRRIPRWLGLVVWPIQLGCVHLAVPHQLSRLGPRFGWRKGGTRPSVANLMGLVPLAAGASLIAWALAKHYETAPKEGWAIRRGIEPEYLLTDGAYRFTRNPMHLGGIGMWLGWTVWYGSPQVAGGMGLLSAVFRAGIAWEERSMERRWGDAWRAFARRTPRWL